MLKMLCKVESSIYLCYEVLCFFAITVASGLLLLPVSEDTISLWNERWDSGKTWGSWGQVVTSSHH